MRTAIARIRACQLVHFLVARVAGMTLDPHESHRPRLCAISLSMARIKSAFFTGFFCEFFQPLRFQPCTHLVEQLIAYCESVSITRSSEPGCARNASSTAHNSPIWLVPFVAPPASQSPACSCPGLPPAAGSWSAQAQPIGPFGLPSAEPSVETVIVMLLPYESRATRRLPVIPHGNGICD